MNSGVRPARAVTGPAFARPTQEDDLSVRNRKRNHYAPIAAPTRRHCDPLIAISEPLRHARIVGACKAFAPRSERRGDRPGWLGALARRAQAHYRTRRRAVGAASRTMSVVGWRERGGEEIGCGLPLKQAFSIAISARRSASPSSPSASGGVPA